MHLPTLLASFSLPILPISSFAINSPPTNLLTLPPTTTNQNLTLPLTIPLARCVQITDPPMLGLNPTNCDLAIPIICNRLTTPPPGRLVRDKWIWTELPGCSLGYYLPEEVIVPFLGQCERKFEEIVERCATDSRFNAGGINVEEMPDFGGDGRAVVVGEVRWAMAPERLTLPG